MLIALAAASLCGSALAEPPAVTANADSVRFDAASCKVSYTGRATLVIRAKTFSGDKIMVHHARGSASAPSGCGDAQSVEVVGAANYTTDQDEVLGHERLVYDVLRDTITGESREGGTVTIRSRGSASKPSAKLEERFRF
jgi:hypothetical protein